jgi:hypothetical protein
VGVRFQHYEEWVEAVHAGGNTCTPSDNSTNAFTDRIPNSSTADCSTDGSTDRSPTDSCADCDTNGSADCNTDGSTDRISTDSCADFFADRCTDARFCKHVGCNFRLVHSRRRMCAERELSAVLRKQSEVRD